MSSSRQTDHKNSVNSYHIYSGDQFEEICKKENEHISVSVESDYITVKNAKIPNIHLKSNLQEINLKFINCNFTNLFFDLNESDTIGNVNFSNCKFGSSCFNNINTIYIDKCETKKIDKAYAFLDFNKCDNVIIKNSNIENKNEDKKLNWAIDNENTKNMIVKNTEINNFDKGIFISESNIKIINSLIKNIHNTAVSTLRKNNKVEIKSTSFKNCKNICYINSATDFSFEDCPKILIERI